MRVSLLFFTMVLSLGCDTPKENTTHDRVIESNKASKAANRGKVTNIIFIPERVTAITQFNPNKTGVSAFQQQAPEVIPAHYVLMVWFSTGIGRIEVLKEHGEHFVVGETYDFTE